MDKRGFEITKTELSKRNWRLTAKLLKILLVPKGHLGRLMVYNFFLQTVVCNCRKLLKHSKGYNLFRNVAQAELIGKRQRKIALRAENFA